MDLFPRPLLALTTGQDGPGPSGEGGGRWLQTGSGSKGESMTSQSDHFRLLWLEA